MADSIDREIFLDWLRQEMDDRRWSATELANRTGITYAQVSNILNDKQSPGPKFLRGVAEAFGEPQAKVFRIAGMLTDEAIEDVQEDEATRQIRRLISMLDPGEQRKAVRLLEQYVRDHRRDAAESNGRPAPSPRTAHSET